MLDVCVRVSARDSPSPQRFDARRLESEPAITGHHATPYFLRKVRRTNERSRILEVPLDRRKSRSQLHYRPLPTTDFDDGRVDPKPPNSFGKPVVVREDDDLSRLGCTLEDASKAVDLGRIHRLNGIVDDHEPERALRQRRAREEDAEG